MKLEVTITPTTPSREVLSFKQAMNAGGVYTMVGEGCHDEDYVIFFSSYLIYFNGKNKKTPPRIQNLETVSDTFSTVSYLRSNKEVNFKFSNGTNN